MIVVVTGGQDFADRALLFARDVATHIAAGLVTLLAARPGTST